MAELTKLTGTYIRSGSIPTTALSGGVVSSSLQIVSALPGGSVSSSAQVTALLPTDVVSSSAQVTSFLPTGTVSSSTQLPSGIASSSAQVKAYLPTDTVSSSIQVTAFLPEGTVSSSTQLPSGIASSSVQIKAYLPTDTVSSSAQVTAFLPAGTVSSSGQVNVFATIGGDTLATTGSNTFTAAQTISDTTNSTSYLDGALHVAGGMSVRQDVRVSGSVTINGLLTAVSMSTQYVTSSQYNVGVSKITLNDDDNVRFAGMSIIDSGSASPTTASIYWDSLQHRFIYENLSGSTYNSAILIAGPKHTGTLGDESTLTSGYIPYATGTDHIDNSVMFQSSSNVGIGITTPTIKLDVVGTPSGSLRLTNATADASNKLGRIVGRPYTYSDTDFLAIDIRGLSTTNEINYGGGSSILNAVTTHTFYTAENNTTKVGTARMIITPSGSIGIGTTAPAAKLDVSGSIYSTVLSWGYPTEAVGTLNRGGSGLADIQIVQPSGQFRIINSAYNTALVVVNESNGNVGVGTNNPATKLDINGIGQARGGFVVGANPVSSDRFFYVSGDTGTTGTSQFGAVINPTLPNTATSAIYGVYSNINLTAGATVTNAYGFYLDNMATAGSTITNKYAIYVNDSSNNYFAGNVGIGTITPTLNGGGTSKVMHINAPGANEWAISHYTNATTGMGGSDGVIVGLIGSDAFITNYETGSIYLQTQALTRVFVGSNGNVGIGTTDPTVKLDVNGGAIVRSGMVVKYSSNTGEIDTAYAPLLVNGQSAQSIVVDEETTTATLVLRGNTDNVNLQLGTGGAGLGYAGWIQASYDNGGSLGTEPLLLNPNGGNVGIGTTNPGSMFQVAGTITSNNETGLPTAGSSIEVSYQAPNDRGRIIAYDRTNGRYKPIIFNDGALFISASSFGMVGIGTTIPEYQLDVVGANGNYWNGTAFTGTPHAVSITNTQPGGYDPVLLFRQTDSGGTKHIAGAIGLVGGNSWTAGNNATQISSMYFLVRNSSGGYSERIRINSAGDVGIGTTAPGARLHIHTGADGEIARLNGASGNYWTTGTDNVGTYIENAGTTTARRTFRIQTSDGAGTYTQFFIKDGSFELKGGNVGIGTTNPTSQLQMHGSANLAFTNAVNTSKFELGLLGGGSDSIAYIYQRANAAMAFGTNNDTKMILSSGGNLGIGTNSPDYKLHVNGDIVNNTNIAGDVGIQLGGNRLGFDQSGTRSWSIKATGGNLQFFSGDNNGYHVFSSAGVGIGTTNPGSYKLYVQGDQYISGTLTEASSIALKENINPITDALSLINNITGYTYDRKDGTAKNQSGLIAEEIARVLPGVVSYDADGNPTGVQYTKVIAYLVESIKELKSELDSLKK